MLRWLAIALALHVAVLGVFAWLTPSPREAASAEPSPSLELIYASVEPVSVDDGARGEQDPADAERLAATSSPAAVPSRPERARAVGEAERTALGSSDFGAAEGAAAEAQGAGGASAVPAEGAEPSSAPVRLMLTPGELHDFARRVDATPRAGRPRQSIQRALEQGRLQQVVAAGGGGTGLLISAARDAARAGGPAEGRARFLTVLDSEGRITGVTLAEGGSEWDDVLRALLQALLGRSVPVGHTARGLHAEIEVDVAYRLPSGRGSAIGQDGLGFDFDVADAGAGRTRVVRTRLVGLEPL